MAGLILLFCLVAVILVRVFPWLANAYFREITEGIIGLAVIYPAARKLGFEFGKVRLYLAAFKAGLAPAFKYFLIMTAVLYAADYVFAMALAPWDLHWTNTLLFWSDQSSNLATRDPLISGLLRRPLLLPTYFLAICAIGPIMEEFVFRRWLYAGMRRWLPVWAAILLNGALFGALHGKDFIDTGLCGFFFCWFYEKTGKLEVPILLHAFTNLLALLLIFGEKIFAR